MSFPYDKRVCVILLVVINYADLCTETYAGNGDQNVQLVFNFNWKNMDIFSTRRTVCYKETTQIGECTWLFGIIRCSKTLDQNVFTFSSSEDFTSIYITILSFKEETVGKYSCSVEDKSQHTFICIQTSANLTSLTLLPKTTVSYPVYNEQSTFTCITSNSRPVSTIHWFVEDRNITDMANYTYSSDVARSSLLYTPKSITNESLTCVAYYLFKSTNITMITGTNMVVQFPVSKPTISINTTNMSEPAVIREGRSVEFKCFAASYPPPTYRWVHPEGIAEGTTVILQFKHTANGGTIACQATTTYYSLNGTVTQRSKTLDMIINLTVLYSPLSVSIKNIDSEQNLSDNSIRIVKGDSLRLSCDSVANPPAVSIWQEQSAHSNILNASSIQEDTQWTCEAFNVIEDKRESITRTVHVVVLYGPVNLTITYNIFPDHFNTGTVLNHGTIAVIDGNTLQLKCSASSIPPSRYSWGNGIEGNNRNASHFSRTTNTSYTCMAENIMNTTFNGTITGRNNISVHLHLLYGPHNMSALFNYTVLINQVLRIIKGWSFGLSCFANSSPASKFSWKYFSSQEDGPSIFIQNIEKGMNKYVTCTGTNTMVDSLGHTISESSNRTIELDVLYPPIVQPIENQYVIINTTLAVECNFSLFGNPSATNIIWTKLNNNRTLYTGETFKIDRAQLSDEGVYQCKATNTMRAIGNKTEHGSSQSQFYIDVQYGAKVKQFYADSSKSSTIAVDQNQTVELICDVDGDPDPVVHIINATGDQQLVLNGSLASFHILTAHIYHARCEYDSGRYKCVANNAHTITQQEQILDVLVKCSPRASPFAPPYKTHYKAPNDTIQLVFTIKAYPPPSANNFTWSKNSSVYGGWQILDNDSHYTISVSGDRMRTELTIDNIRVDDFGAYQVNVANTLGSSTEVFSLHAKAMPEIPKGVYSVRRGITEIDLEWIPGFNGGEQQTFIISYTEINLESWNSIRVPANSKTHTLTGLKSATVYKVKMRAENLFGNSSWTEYIQISTLADIEDKGSASKAIGGTIGGLTVFCIIVAVSIFWRRRIKDQKDSISQQMLPNRSGSQKCENTSYENIGMLTPNLQKHNITSSHPATGNLQQPIKNLHASNTHVTNNKTSHTGALGSTNKRDLTKTPETEFPHRRYIAGDIRRTRKADVDANVKPNVQDSCSLEQDPIYDNLVKKQKQFRSRDITIHNLREAVVKAKDDSTEVFSDFSALHVASESISYSTEAALKSANTSKNRYKNMYPYDKNRVKLPVVGNNIDTDFINASFIDGYSSPKKYIAAQGPLASTRADFWSMIWEQNVGVIAMVTNLVEDSKRKCFQYWPTSPENDCQYSDYTIRLLSEETYANFVVRTLHCTKKGSIKVQTVNHLHFTAWPDKDVPDTALSLMQFWRKVRNVEKPDGASWIVHCSAGVGRTGTFIAVDYLYDQGISEKQINVFDAVLLLRQQRINMVQTKNQYLYLHEVLCEALCTVGKVLTNTAFMDTPRTSESLNQEYQHICESHIPDREEAGEDGEYTLVLDGEKPDNRNKNADQCVVPDDRYRPVLNMTFTTLGHNDYINAVYISTFGEKDRLILTQSARVSSEIDFVRLLHDHSLRTVVTFADEVEPYMPGSSDSCLIGPFTATTKSDTQKQFYQESVVQFKYIAEYEGFDVRIIRFTKWSNTLDVCNIKDLLSLLISVQESACKRPVVLQCRDGYSQSGLFAVLWCLVERCKQDGEVAVAETVRMIRRRRNQVITNETQYRFCHQFMKEYIEGCQVYANT